MAASNVTPPALQASFSLSKGALTVHVRLVNESDVPLLAFDRLWDLDPASKLVPDAEGIYRFVEGGALRLLLGLAPPPANKNVLYRNVPYVTRVEPHATLEHDIVLTAPVREHNVYFPPKNKGPQNHENGNAPEGFAADVAKSVELFVEYLPATADIKTSPSPLLPGAFNLNTPGVWSKALLVRSGAKPLAVPVLRRTGEFQRWTPPSSAP
jgi:hypothetical protein